jgi:hypothetical protein
MKKHSASNQHKMGHNVRSPFPDQKGGQVGWNSTDAPLARSNRLHRSSLEGLVKVAGKSQNSLVNRNVAQSGARSWFNPANRHTYRYLPGQMNQQEAWQAARSQGGYPVVFHSLTEWRQVMQAFDYRTITANKSWVHTGHYQLPMGREPGEGWVTYTNERSARLDQLFNSNGPDDGIRNKWGWMVSYNSGDDSAGVSFFYGPSNGKNEDAGVIWYDNEGRLEDISVNARGGVMVEFNR